MTTLPADTRIADVHLQVADLERSLGFYRDLLGLRLLDTSDGEARLSATGAGPALLHLSERPDAISRPRRAPGLFHVAWRAPSRAELGRWLRRLLDPPYPLQGASDHFVSEALYLADPDGLGVELYVDRPRNTWPMRGRQVAMGSERLDTGALVAAAEGTGPWEGVHRDTDVGHVHLCVSSLEAAEAFYGQALGLEVMQRDFPGALFLAAGGYHHHLGTNTWQSGGAGPAPGDAVGLRSWTLGVPAAADLAAVRNRLSAAGVSVAGEDGVLEARDGDDIAVRVRAEEE